MAIIEIKIPSPGESITSVELSRWLVEEGAVVQKDTEIAELESEKATLMLVAEGSGKISLKAAEGESIEVGAVACTIDTSVQPEVPAAPPVEEGSSSAQSSAGNETEGKVPQTIQETSVSSAGKSAPTDTPTAKTAAKPSESEAGYDKIKITPLAKKVMLENGLSVEDVINGLRRLKREDVEAVMGASDGISTNGLKKPVSRGSKSERMS